MPQCCAVPFCSVTKGGHKFPCNPERLRKWLNAIGRKDYVPSKHARVCKKHFKPEDYEPQKPNSLLFLKKTAVPSRFVWTDWKDVSGGNGEVCFVQYLNENTVVEKSGFVIDIQGKESNHRSKIKANVNSTMSETANENSVDSEKPVQHNEDVKFPPFPDPLDNDFDDDITEEERNHYRDKFKDLNTVKGQRLHCSACDRHLGCSPRNESRMRSHPMLRTLVCHTCHSFYNSGEFEKGDDGSELYCRWCGQGGQVYCCSDCPHVFCARCIRRNLGIPKIKEIEQTDDWKCFKCNPKCLWDLRAICWAVLRYCNQKNKIAYNTEDPQLKDLLQKDCIIDHSECCKNKSRKKEKPEIVKKRELELAGKKSSAASIISKISPAIQVKKFASINPDDRQEKKPQKRSASPKPKPIFIKNPMTMSGPSNLSPMSLPNQPPKKIRMTPPPMINPIRFNNDRKQNSIMITRFKLKPSGLPILPQNQQFNGFNNPNPFSNMATNDNINLSLDNLTQGLDMATVAAMSGNSGHDDDVVCTPDLPLEPLCEVMEDNADDDVQCITPGPVAAPKAAPSTPGTLTTLPPLIPRVGQSLPDLAPENIVQMTENDVTVNSATGGLKFRVDPQTLSSNKMYRLPDGRIFAINANPTMPGGYSATIVAITESHGKSAPKGATYAAKLSAVTSPQLATPPPLKTYGSKVTRSSSKRNSQKAKVHRGTDTSSRECDLSVPIEWYRYNLIDAVDALEYSLSRLHKLKKEATTMYLRTRSISEMRNLHKSLDRLLSTSVCRFNEVRENIGKEMKIYIAKKMGMLNNTSEEDDDVEILPDLEDNDDPIFIDENSVESSAVESQEVDLTGASEHNNSTDKSIDRTDSVVNVTACLNIDNEDASIENSFNDDQTVHDLVNAEDKEDGEDTADKNEFRDDKNESGDDKNASGDDKNASGDDKNESGDDKNESGDDKNESDGPSASFQSEEKEVNGDLDEDQLLNSPETNAETSGDLNNDSPVKNEDDKLTDDEMVADKNPVAENASQATDPSEVPV